MAFKRKYDELLCILFVAVTGLVVEGDESRMMSCHYDVDIIQSHHFGNSPIVGTPLVADVDADGNPDIVATTFDGIMSIVDGGSMKQHSNWPHQFENSTIYASPLLFDVDADGIKEVVICTSDGDIHFFKIDGNLMPHRTVQIPELLVSKQWLNTGLSVDSEIEQFVSTSRKSGLKAEDFIARSAHILATPVLADLNRDGREEELVLPVSYYDQLDSPRPGPNDSGHLDMVTSALVIINLTSGDIISQTPLHLSKQSDPAPAYLLYPPTLVDLDGKLGPLEVIVPTPSGLLHVMDATGQARAGFPVIFDGPISGQISVADIEGDADLEMIVVQTSGEVTCLSNHGNKKWTSQISSSSFPGSRLADIDGDGVLDVVIPSADGNVWVLSGETGNPLPHWPVYLGSRLVSNLVITSLTNSSTDVEILITGYDRNLYIISTSGQKPCIESINLEESSLTPVQVADIIPTSPGPEIMAATIHGSVMVMSSQDVDDDDDDDDDEVAVTGRRWVDATSEERFAFRQHKHGVFVTEDTKLKSYIGGSAFTINFDIVDDRKSRLKDSFEIKVFAGSICLHPPTVFSQPGRYSLQVAAPSHMITTLVEVHMTNRHGQVSVDSYPVSFNTKVTDDIQWLLVIPTVAMAILLLILYGYPEVDLLPSSHASKGR